MLENDNTDFQREYNVAIKKEVIAFANSSGGKIYIGCDEEGSDDRPEDVSAALTQIADSLRDGVLPDVSKLLDFYTEKSGIVITVLEGTGKPYFLTDKGINSSGVYVRQGASSVPADYEQIRDMIKLTGDRFETTRSLRQDLTFMEAAAEFSRNGISFDEEQMQLLGITGFDGLFTNLGLLLSDQCAHKVRLFEYSGTNSDELRSRRELDGSVLRQMRTVIDCLKTSGTSLTASQPDHNNQHDYPDIIIREAVINAIIHRDYMFSGSIIINRYDDRIEFLSIGGLIPGLQPEDLFLGISQPRNKSLAEVFYRLKFIEAYGTGLRRIMQYYEEYLEQPVITATNGAFALTIPNMIYAHPQPSANQPKSQHQVVLDYLRENAFINNDIVQEILSVRKTRAYKIIREMVDDGLIIKSGAGKEDKDYILS